MSLLHFHRLLIATAILFCGGYAGWELTAAMEDGGTGSLILGGTFAFLALLLLFYLLRLRSFLGYDEGEPSAR